MSKGLEALEKIKEIIREDAEDIDNPRLLVDEIYVIEKELKDKEQQDSALKTLKEVIAFDKKLPDIEIDDDGNIECIIGAVGFKIQRQMENKERELLRKWVLETCFPKELKALEIIKEKKVNVYLFCLIQVFSKDTQLERYNDTDFIPKENFLTQEKYDLLKEVLL